MKKPLWLALFLWGLPTTRRFSDFMIVRLEHCSPVTARFWKLVGRGGTSVLRRYFGAVQWIATRNPDLRQTVEEERERIDRLKNPGKYVGK